MRRYKGPGFQSLVIVTPVLYVLCIGSTGRAECRRSGTRFRPDHWRWRVAFWGERPRKKSMNIDMNIDAWAGGPPAWFVNADGPMGMMDAFAAEEEEEEVEEEDDDDEEGPWGV